MPTIKTKLLNQLFLLAIIIGMGVLILMELAPYFSGILGAITFYFLMKGSMVRLEKRKWRKEIAATTLMILSFFIILIPTAGIIMMLMSKVNKASKNFGEVIEIIHDKISSLEYSTGIDITSNVNETKITEWMSQTLGGLVGSTFNTLIAISIMYFLLYFMLINNQNLGKYLKKYIPLKDDSIQILGKETKEMVRSNAIGIPLVAICQGIIALIGYVILGVPDPFFWFVITTIGAMIPFVGTAIGTFPVVIIMFSQGQNWEAIALLLYSTIVVGSTDNILRLVVLKKLSDVHPLITLIGVIIGVPLFGFIGLIFGPLLLSLFLLAIKIYRENYGETN